MRDRLVGHEIESSWPDLESPKSRNDLCEKEKKIVAPRIDVSCGDCLYHISLEKSLNKFAPVLECSDDGVQHTDIHSERRCFVS